MTDTVENTPVEEQSLIQEQTLADGEYFLADGIKGVGDMPDFYKSDKYKTVADQAKAYTELEKKFGGFTGAPEAYTLSEDFAQVAESPMYQEFSKFALESGMNQETHDKLVSTFIAGEQLDNEQKQAQELALLGDNAQQRINQADGFLRNSLDADAYEQVKGLVTTADNVQIVEMLIKATQPKRTPFEGGENPNGITEQALQEMQTAKDEYGNRKMDDPAYAANYRAKAAQFYGNQ